MLGGMRGTADGSFSAEVKAAVTLRARSGCERCGRWCGEGAWAEHHHRIPRGMGGAAAERAAILSSPANCLLLCARCHRWVEANRGEATAAGFLVPWSLDPAEVLVDVYDRGPTLLSVGGGYVRPAVSAGPSPRPGRVRARW